MPFQALIGYVARSHLSRRKKDTADGAEVRHYRHGDWIMGDIFAAKLGMVAASDKATRLNER